jgi:hypothetical protein
VSSPLATRYLVDARLLGEGVRIDGIDRRDGSRVHLHVAGGADGQATPVGDVLGTLTHHGLTAVVIAARRDDPARSTAAPVERRAVRLRAAAARNRDRLVVAGAVLAAALALAILAGGDPAPATGSRAPQDRRGDSISPALPPVAAARGRRPPPRHRVPPARRHRHPHRHDHRQHGPRLRPPAATRRVARPSPPPPAPAEPLPAA